MENFHISILAGLPRNLGHWNAEKREYEDMQGRKFQCFPSSALAKQKQKSEWILFFHLLETKNLYSLFNAEINPEYLLMTSPQLLKKSYSAINFNPDKGFVYAFEKQTFGRHVIQSGKRVHYGNINPAESRKVFIEENVLTIKLLWIKKQIQLDKVLWYTKNNLSAKIFFVSQTRMSVYGECL